MKTSDKAFVAIILCWLLSMILMVIYIIKEINWLWWLIGIFIFIGIVIYHYTGGPEAFWYYNKKLNRERRDK